MGSTESRESYSVTTRSMARFGTRKQSSKYWTWTRTGGGDESGGTRTGGISGLGLVVVYGDGISGLGLVVVYGDGICGLGLVVVYGSGDVYGGVVVYGNDDDDGAAAA